MSTLLSLLLGALIGGVAKVIQDFFTRVQETRAVAAALEAEISVLLDGVRRSGCIGLIDRVVAHLSTPAHVVQDDDFIELPVSHTPFPIYTAHAAKIGLLGAAAGSVVKTYQLFETVVLDFQFLPQRHKQRPLTVSQPVDYHNGLKRGCEVILTNGDLAIRDLRELQQTWWSTRRLGQR